jgi:hypothetical protein
VGYDLFGTTNLSVATEAGALNATNWTWLYRAAGGETNIVIPMTWPAEGYFRLAGTNDADGDSLSDAFETLVSHSSASTNDSDGDGLLDAWEWTHFGNFNQTDADDFDGDNANNLAEQSGGTDPNTLGFTLPVTNTAWAGPATVTVDVTQGVPFAYALRLDPTNFTVTDWQTYQGVWLAWS